MNLYESNIAFIKKNATILYDVISNQSPRHDFQLEIIEEDLNCHIKHKGVNCYLHSVYNKENEMKQMFKGVNKDAQLLVVFGFGCGYALDYITRELCNVKIIIFVEPCIDIFKAILTRLDLQKEFERSGKTIIILPNEDPSNYTELLNSSFKYIVSKIDFACHVSYCALFPNEYGFLTRAVVSILQDNAINIQAESLMLNILPSNIIKNLYHPAISAELLMKKIEGSTAIIVSAGPSLNNNMHLLKCIGDKALIVAVGSASIILHNNGITPHLRCAIDPYEDTIFKDIDTSAAPILYGNTIAPEIIPNYKGEKFRMLLITDHITSYLYNNMGVEFKMVISAFSVANVAFDFLIKSRCGRIILMGQDLSFTGGDRYAKGSWADWKLKENDSSWLVETEDIYGAKTFTSKAFIGIKNIFEDLIKANKTVEVVNCTEGGLHIAGSIDKPLRDIIPTLDPDFNAQKVFNDIYNEFDASKKIEFQEAIKREMETLFEDIENILKINKLRISKLKTIRKNIENERPVDGSKILSSINKLSTFEEDLLKYKAYGKLILPMLMKTIQAISCSNDYTGPDIWKTAEAKCNVLLGSSVEINQYASMLKTLLLETKQ